MMERQNTAAERVSHSEADGDGGNSDTVDRLFALWRNQTALTGRNRRFHSCRELAAKRAFKKDDIRQASIATSAGEGGGNTAGETGCRAGPLPWIVPFRSAPVSSHICHGWHLRRPADRRAYSGHRWTRTAVKDRSASRAVGGGNNSHRGTDT